MKKVLLSTVFASSVLLSTVATSHAAVTNTNPPNDDVADPPSGENVRANEVIEEIEAQTPASVTGETMQGNGTVVDYTTSGSKAFYTITDTEQNTFYLIIVMDKTANNVYFLKSVNQTDLENVAIAEQPNTNEGIAPVPPPAVENPEIADSEESSNLGFLLMVLLVSVLGVAAYYFLVMRKRHNDTTNDENEDEDDFDEDYNEDFKESDEPTLRKDDN